MMALVSLLDWVFGLAVDLRVRQPPAADPATPTRSRPVRTSGSTPTAAGTRPTGRGQSNERRVTVSERQARRRRLGHRRRAVLRGRRGAGGRRPGSRRGRRRARPRTSAITSSTRATRTTDASTSTAVLDALAEAVRPRGRRASSTTRSTSTPSTRPRPPSRPSRTRPRSPRRTRRPRREDLADVDPTRRSAPSCAAAGQVVRHPLLRRLREAREAEHREPQGLPDHGGLHLPGRGPDGGRRRDQERPAQDGHPRAHPRLRAGAHGPQRRHAGRSSATPPASPASWATPTTRRRCASRRPSHAEEPRRDQEAPAAKSGRRKGGKQAQRVIPAEVDFEIGETITIKEGSFAGLPGSISEIKPESGKLTVLVSLFERETPVELSFDQVTKL